MGGGGLVLIAMPLVSNTAENTLEISIVMAREAKDTTTKFK